MNARITVASIIGAAVLASAVAACGNDDGGESADAEAEITQAIEAVATTGDPSVCTEYQTQAFVEQVVGEGLTGEKAVAACERFADESLADSIAVGDIEVDGDSATATGAITGSSLDGQTLELALVDEGGTWKLDAFTGFAAFDRERLLDGYSKEIAEYAPPAMADCVSSRMRELSDADLQDYVLNPSPENVELVFGPCEGPA